eukprot:GHVN01023316.1.p1 GENE.GHVN01023316.1~~GHVN01023316.1.p1  ORF type:complete len:307 (-),score=39.30 GHVN01023316.1:183-1103(-)
MLKSTRAATYMDYEPAKKVMQAQRKLTQKWVKKVFDLINTGQMKDTKLEAKEMEEQKIHLLKARENADKENKRVQDLLDFATSATDSEMNAKVAYSLSGDTQVKQRRAILKQLKKVIDEIKQGKMNNKSAIEELINQYKKDLKEARENADVLFIKERAARLSEWYRDAHKKSDQDIKKTCLENSLKQMEELLHSPDVTSDNRVKVTKLQKSIERDLTELDGKTREMTLAPSDDLIQSVWQMRSLFLHIDLLLWRSKSYLHRVKAVVKFRERSAFDHCVQVSVIHLTETQLSIHLSHKDHRRPLRGL